MDEKILIGIAVIVLLMISAMLVMKKKDNYVVGPDPTLSYRIIEPAAVMGYDINRIPMYTRPNYNAETIYAYYPENNYTD